MKHSPPEKRDGFLSLRLVLALLAAVLLPLVAYAAAPAWWAERGIPVQGATADDYAPANQGQLKNIAKAAVAEMDAKLPGGAGDALHNLVASWSSPGAQTNDFAPLNLGQLKSVAIPFYERLILMRYVDTYPWAGSSNGADDFSAANLGQIKNLFSFDFVATDAAHDSDGNGLPDWWEKYYFGQNGIDPNGDADGDGLTNRQEYETRTNPFSFVDDDADGLPDDWETVHAGEFAAYPQVLRARLPRLSTETKPLFLNNATGQDIHYSVAVLNGTEGGYTSDDSKTGGVTFAWEDISATGTRLHLISDADDGAETVTFENFTFPFYGQNYSEVHASSNGHLTFETPSSAFTNQRIPGREAPPLLVAPFWDDLNPSVAGDIYVQQLSDRVIVQYQEVKHFAESEGNYTFQVVLFADGTIEFRYLSLTGNTTSCTAGIQNADQTAGLEVVYNGPYLEDNLAVRIKPGAFVEVAPLSGVVAPYATAQLGATFHSSFLSPGTYEASIQIAHDGPGAQTLSVPAVLDVINLPSTVALVIPAANATGYAGQNLTLRATATDADSRIERVEFYADSTKVAESFDPSGGQPAEGKYSATWTNLPLGVFALTARAVDHYGHTTVSAAVTLTVVPAADDSDADNDGLLSSEELNWGTNPANPDSDYDELLDGREVQLGTDPLDPDTDDDGLSDGAEVNTYQSDPLHPDTDRDGLSDGSEVFTHNTSPTNPDSDGDFLSDGYEVGIPGFDANNPDVNEDGIWDGIAILTGISVTNMDVDGDGLTNALEYQMGTNPFYADSDGDGVSDDEDAFPLDPARSQAIPGDPNDHTPPLVTITFPTSGITLL